MIKILTGSSVCLEICTVDWAAVIVSIFHFNCLKTKSSESECQNSFMDSYKFVSK